MLGFTVIKPYKERSSKKKKKKKKKTEKVKQGCKEWAGRKIVRSGEEDTLCTSQSQTMFVRLTKHTPRIHRNLSMTID